MAKFFALFFSLLSLPRYKSFFVEPMHELKSLAIRTLRMSAFLSKCFYPRLPPNAYPNLANTDSEIIKASAIGTAWGSICFFTHYFPRTSLPQARWFWGGFAAGLWALLERKNGRGNFLYSARMSIDSFWKVGKKRGWWKGFRGGDVWVFVLGLGVLNAVYEVDKEAIRGGGVRIGVGWLRGEELFKKKDHTLPEGGEATKKEQ